MKTAEATLEEITITAVVTRASGSVEDLGTICHWQRGVDEAPPPRGFLKSLKDFFLRNNLKDEITW